MTSTYMISSNARQEMMNDTVGSRRRVTRNVRMRWHQKESEVALTAQQILTLTPSVPAGWAMEVRASSDDLDNLQPATLPLGQPITASFTLSRLLLHGSCIDAASAASAASAAHDATLQGSATPRRTPL